MRTTLTLGLFTLGLVVATAGRLAAYAADEAEPPRVTLMGSLAEWMYPDATMPHGATMKEALYADVPGVNCHAVLETKDDFAKVVAYYEKALAAPEADAAVGETPPALAQSVDSVDDSEGRPVKLRVITIARPTSSTTLVISHGAGEKVTHISWSQHRNLAVRE